MREPWTEWGDKGGEREGEAEKVSLCRDDTQIEF